MEGQNGLCRGCCRTLDEIAHWAAMNDREREAVLRKLTARHTESRVARIPEA